MRHTSLIACVLTGLLLCACADDHSQPAPIIRLDRTLAAFASLDSTQQTACADSLRPEINAMFAVMDRPAPSIAQLVDWSQSEVVRVFQPDIDSAFHNLNTLERQLGHILYMAHCDSLGLPPIQFATVAWGRPQPIVRVDSIVLIALNHYLGSQYPGYSHWESFRREEKSPQRLPYDIAAALAATQHPFATAQKPTVLNWMLYEGALVKARMDLVPDARLNLALGYTPDQLQMLDDNARDIWEEMAMRQMIYDTDPMTIARLFTAAPNSPLLGQRAPARVGRYIGYLIVEKYLHSHPHAKLPFLLSPQFYDDPQSLIQSGF